MTRDVDVRLTHARAAALTLLLAPLACALTSPIVQTQVMQVSPGMLQKVAVAPFLPDPSLQPRSEPPVSAALAAELVTRFVAEALAARGIAVVAPNDLTLAFESQGTVRRACRFTRASFRRRHGTLEIVAPLRSPRLFDGDCIGDARHADTPDDRQLEAG